MAGERDITLQPWEPFVQEHLEHVKRPSIVTVDRINTPTPGGKLTENSTDGRLIRCGSSSKMEWKGAMFSATMAVSENKAVLETTAN